MLWPIVHARYKEVEKYGFSIVVYECNGKIIDKRG
jgi:hypothetical protein